MNNLINECKNVFNTMKNMLYPIPIISFYKKYKIHMIETEILTNNIKAFRVYLENNPEVVENFHIHRTLYPEKYRD